MLVIMPLITGGAAASLLKMFGIRLPGGLAGLMGASRGMFAHGFGFGFAGLGEDGADWDVGYGGGYSSYSRGGSSDMFGGASFGSMMRVAQMFI